MSKVSKRQEIKEKEALQAKFQLALKQQTLTVLSWLPTEESPADSTEEALRTADKAKFLDLPILSNGSGLYELEREGARDSVLTIGSFISAEETSTRTKLPQANMEKKGRPASKAMASLMNKMRGDTRRQIHEREREKGRLRHSEVKPPTKVEPDSDDEESKLSQIQRKSFKPPVGGKKGKARPF